MSTNKIPVVIATDGIFPHTVGGMQRHSRLLVEHLAKTGEVDLTVIHPHKGTQVFESELQVHEIALPGIDESKNYLRECKRYSARVMQELKAFPSHLIYAQGLSVWEDINQVSDRLIVNPHGLEPYQALSRKDKLVAIPFKLVFDKIFNAAARVVSLGGMLTGILEGRLKNTKSIVVLPNATNLPESKPQHNFPDSNEPVELLFVSRFAANKGIHVLMEVIDRLHKAGLSNRFTFHLAGKGPLFEEYSSKVKHDNVNFLGFVEDDQLAELYRTSHAFVLPTLFEGMPTVVLEAMSNALPIIVSNVGATAEQVDSSNGYLLPKNDPDALYRALLNFAELSRDQKQAMADASFKRLEERFTWQAVTERHLALFRELRQETLAKQTA